MPPARPCTWPPPPHASKAPPSPPRTPAYLARDGAVLYENPHALLLCRYDRTTALCHKDTGQPAPALDHCVAGCPNALRTDQHATQLRQRADLLTQQALHLPAPIAERLKATAARLRHHASTHDTTRTTAGSSTP